MLTKTKVKSVTNLQMSLAVLSLFLGGSFAFATFPLSSKVKLEEVTDKSIKPITVEKSETVTSFELNSTTSLDTQNILQKNNALKQEINLLKPFVLKTDLQLTNLLLESEKVLNEYNKKFQIADIEEKELLLHSFSLQQIDDKIQYLKKTKNLPETLYQFSLILNKNEKILAQLQKEQPEVSFSQELAVQKELKLALTQLQFFQNKSDNTNIEKVIISLKKQTLPKLLQNRKKFSSKERNSEVEIFFLESQTDILRLLQLKLPFYSKNLSQSITDFALARRDPIDLRTAICLLRWRPEDEIPNAENLRTVIDDVNSYYDEVLFGKFNTSISNIVISDVWDTENNGFPASQYEEIVMAVEMCDPSIDFANIDMVIVYPSLMERSFGPKPMIETEEGSFTKPMPHIRLNEFDQGTVTHEIGHSALGLGHANRIDCGEDSFRSDYVNCNVIEYGNIFDVMGLSLRGHLGAWYKYLAGRAFNKQWVSTQTIQSDGEYTLKALEVSTEGKQLLRIPYQVHPLCIEYRKPIGIDGEIRDLLSGDAFGALQTIPQNGGILLNLCYTDNPRERGIVDLPFAHIMSGSALVIDVSPHVHNNLNDQERDNADIFLQEGVLFQNEALGITVNWELSGEENTAIVHIDIDEDRL